MDEKQKERKYQKVLYISTLFYSIAVIIFLFSIGYTLKSSSHIEQIPFDRHVWIDGNEKELGRQHYRFAMIDDVIENHLVIGISKEAVDQLLGKPDEIIDGYYCYLLGSNDGMFGISFLYVYFNDRDEVNDIEISHD